MDREDRQAKLLNAKQKSWLPDQGLGCAMDPQPAGAGAGGASTAMNMTCLQCFKQIRLDASLLAADFRWPFSLLLSARALHCLTLLSMLGINRLAALSTQLKSQASPSASDPSGLDVSYRCGCGQAGEEAPG